MTQAETLYNFFSSFGIPAYPSNSVPNDVVFPWLTYEAKICNPMDASVSCAVNIYYHTNSEKVLNAKAQEIADEIGLGGICLKYDSGVIWVKRGEPWATPLVDANDASIKQRQLLCLLEYM